MTKTKKSKEKKFIKSTHRPYIVHYGQTGAVGTVYAKSVTRAAKIAKSKVTVKPRK